MKAYTEQSYYELLEVSPSATIEEIVAAYQRAARLYDADSVALYPVGDPAQVEELKKLLLEAVEILSDPELRREYDKGLGITSSPEQAPASAPLATVTTAPRPQGAGEEAASPGGNEVQPAPRDRGPSTARPAASEAEAESPAQPRPPTPQRVHSTGPGYSISYLPKAAPTPRAHPVRSNESASASRALGPASAAGPELRSLAPALPLPAGAETSAADRWAMPPIGVRRSHPGGPADPSLASAAEPHASRPGGPLPSGASPSAEANAGHVSAPGPSSALDGAAEIGASKAPVHPAPAAAEPSRESPRPATARRALDSAPAIAQDSAIADAESALAHVHAQAAQRARDPRPRGIDIPPDAVFNGELLRHVRKARGMSLQVLAERTRISPRHIENLEADRYDALPATVYLRGIVMSIARELGLDPLRVSKAYLALVEKQLGRK
jgi:curved DNA-binding protein CbpA